MMRPLWHRIDAQCEARTGTACHQCGKPATKHLNDPNLVWPELNSTVAIPLCDEHLMVLVLAGQAEEDPRYAA